MTRTDYVVVGAGPGGAVVANRLTAGSQARVVVLEAGPADIHPMVHIPSGFTKLRKYGWPYRTVEQTALGGVAKGYPQGRILGGATSTNAMIYVRGQREDYDEWAEQGNFGWSYDDVLPYFRRAESYPRADHYHGTSGPLRVGRLPSYHALSEAFVAAGQEIGLPYNQDFNGARQLGVGYYDVTQRHGLRSSASSAYLWPARHRPTLRVLTGATVTELILDQGRAVGVRYLRRGQVETLYADREVVLCGGAINTPALLLRSGIGPADELRQVGVTPLVDLPGVGRNLQDHLDVCLTASTTVPSYNELGHSWRLAAALAEYALHHSGPITSNVCEAGLFWDSDASQRPDIQMSALPTYGNGQRRLGHGFTINVSNLRPISRGTVTLASPDPSVAPGIDPRFLAEPKDWQITRLGIDRARELLQTRAMRAFGVVEQEPGPRLGSDRELRDYTNARSRTGYHPVGTCAMGIGPQAVVDPQLRVYGVEQLRIVDSSVMPRLISGNTMAPAYLVGEKGADLLLGRELVRSAGVAVRSVDRN